MNKLSNLSIYLANFNKKVIKFFKIGFLELKADFKTTYVGLFWLPLTSFLFAALLSILFRPDMDRYSFFLYVYSGLILWNFIQTTIIRSLNLIEKNFETAVTLGLSLGDLFLKSLCFRLIELFINISFFLLFVFFVESFNFKLLFLIPIFLLIIILSSLSLSLIINVLSIYFSDFSNLIQIFTRILFFISPVFWVASERSDLRKFLSIFNPISSYLDSFRQVFSLTTFNSKTWIICIILTIFLCMLSVYLFYKNINLIKNIK